MPELMQLLLAAALFGTAGLLIGMVLANRRRSTH